MLDIDMFDVNSAFSDVKPEENNNYFQRIQQCLFELNRCCSPDDLEKLVDIAHSGDINKLYGIKKRWDKLRETKGSSKIGYRADIDTMSIVNDYYRGMNASQISKKYGCSYTLVVDRLKKMGCYRSKKR